MGKAKCNLLINNSLEKIVSKIQTDGNTARDKFCSPSQGREMSKQTGTAVQGPSTRGQTHRKDHPSLA